MSDKTGSQVAAFAKPDGRKGRIKKLEKIGLRTEGSEITGGYPVGLVVNIKGDISPCLPKILLFQLKLVENWWKTGAVLIQSYTAI